MAQNFTWYARKSEYIMGVVVQWTIIGAYIKRVSVLKNLRVRSDYVAIHWGLFRVPASLICASFDVANSFEARIADVLAWLLFASETSDANSACMRGVHLWRVRAPKYSDEAFDWSERYEHVVAIRRCFDTGLEEMRFLAREQTSAAWEQMRISWIFSRTVLHLLFDRFGPIL